MSTELTVNTSNIDAQITQLANDVLNEQDIDKTKDLVQLFNWNISKKNVSRVLKLNNLFDDISDQMVDRFKNRADQFSNSDLLDYMKAVQNAIDTSSKVIQNAEEPKMIIQNNNNTQINVNVADSFDRESRARILAAVQQTLRQAAQNNSDAEFVIDEIELQDEQ